MNTVSYTTGPFQTADRELPSPGWATRRHARPEAEEEGMGGEVVTVYSVH